MNDDLRKWLPWILVAAVAVIIVIVIAVNSGGSDDEAAATTTTAGDSTTTSVEETTTTVEETTTTVEDTTTSEAPVAFEPIPLTIGTVLPQTGQLAAIIDALENPIRMGADEINAVSDGLVSIEYGDSGTDPNVASATVDKYLTGDHNGIIGAAASGVSLSIVDKVQGSEVAMCSGSNTAATLSSADYDPYYSRTAPSDNLQAPALAGVIIDDGFADIAVIWRSDDYGVGFGTLLADELEAAGATVVLRTGYDFAQTSFADVAAEVAASGAEALAMITFDEGGQILLDLEGAAYEGAIYVADGFKDTVGADQLGGRVDLLDGIKGTAPSASPENGESTFPARLEAAFPGTPTIFSAQMYDCLVVTTLAAQAAQSADPAVFVAEVGNVTKGGEKCSIFEDCFALLSEGKDIDYDGASGPLDFGPSNEPGIGTYDVFIYDAEGNTATLTQIVAGA